MTKEKWISDPAHSEVYFKVKHLMISTVTGYFKNFTVEAYTENDDFTKATGIEFSAEVDSIDTKNPGRDNHPDLERAEAKRMKATTIELKTSHVPMVSQPKNVADFIIAAAQKL